MPWRALVVPKKLPFKVQDSFSFLAVQVIRIGKANQVVMETDASSFQFEFSSLDDLERVIIHVVTSLKRLFPESSPGNLLQHASLSLTEKIQDVTGSLGELLKEKQSPCGGFSETYGALCDYIGIPVQEEIQWNPDVVQQILHMLSKSVVLEELVLENCGLKFDFAQEMAQVLSNHPDSTLNAINLSRNLLEDRGSMNALCLSLVSSGLFRTSLNHLDLSGNPGSLVTEGASGLFCLLNQPNALRYLDLSGTDCALHVIFDALASGCCRHLIHLKLSKNIYSHKKNRDVPPAINNFFSKASALQHVSLAGTKLPPEAVRAVLQGLAYNTHLSGLHLDLSSCELGSAGAQVIQDLVSDASSICDLNLSDNGFDCDIVTLVLAISRSRSIKHIGLGKNFNIRSRTTLADTLHRIVQLTQDDDCSIQSISVAESQLKMGTSIILDGLRSSRSSLTVLDISGNGMGETGAKLLAKALSVNRTLRTLIWDRNNTTLCGFLHFTRALERNFTLKIMPLPMVDVTQVYRSHPEKMKDVVHQIQSYLARNQMEEAMPKKRCLLQPITRVSSWEQAVKDACHCVQTHIDILSSVQDVEVKADIQKAEEALKDANLSSDASMQARFDALHSLCPQILQKPGFWDKLIHSVPEKAILDKLLVDMNGKLREIQVLVSESMARAITDKALGELTAIQGKLYKLAVQWEPICSMNILPALHENSLSELEVQKKVEPREESGTPPAELSLSIIRASSAKSRPASTKDAEEPGSRLLLPAAPAPSLMDLPTAGEKLEHYTRGRPRPNRRNRQPPSKTQVQAPVRENDEDRSIARLDEGLDEFFTKKVIHERLPPVSSENSLVAAAVAAAPISYGSRTFKKKIGHFFAFKKPKSNWGATRSEKEPESNPVAARSRKSMLSDILRTYSKASESTKGLSKSDEDGLAVDSRGYLEQSQTPDSGRRAKPKYSREGKSQSLILLSGEDEEGLGVQHEKRSFGKTDVELPSSFEQRVHVMLHRIGVTKVLSSEPKKKQVNNRVAFRDIVDSSTEVHSSLKSRTHSMSTAPSVRIDPSNTAEGTGAEPSGGSSEGRRSWKALGRQLNVELKGKGSELSCSPRRAFAAQDPAASHTEQKGRESWSSSLPRRGQSTQPLRRSSNAGEGQSRAELQNPCADDVNTIAEDNQLKPKSRLKPVANRRAMSVHEEQFREQACVTELLHAKIPHCLQQSPLLKWKSKSKSPLEPETPASFDRLGTSPQGRNMVAPESKLRPETREES
ncbi:hypothetical protein JRQ81_006262 [Phrynocephalus forsythii]|uniref:Capping protein regulator and myosin 1 linker 2 n=1 Tax=Phrynocephalus forsythii TaxID=171643 RepID=A0A9Q0XEI5_9SAUR|nr:hypothetical protein JRQ81_006262 [Phrynocephalus forsythii]